MLWPLLTGEGTQVPWSSLSPLTAEKDYEAHEAAATALGFELFAKAAKVGMSKHVRVRPRFNAWSISGSITVVDETITGDILQLILEMAGTYCGLGDWRPSSPGKPGPWGRFRATTAVLR
jgi:hypothetical protein